MKMRTRTKNKTILVLVKLRHIQKFAYFHEKKKTQINFKFKLCNSGERIIRFVTKLKVVFILQSIYIIRGQKKKEKIAIFLLHTSILIILKLPQEIL